jgi:hypothetical protein
MKTKSLVLFHPAYRNWKDPGNPAHKGIPREEGYGIASVKNSADYLPGQFLTKTEVKDLCEISAWEISIRPRGEKDRTND